MNSIKTLNFILVLGCLVLANRVNAQQMNFSQYSLTPMQNNPSLISLSDEIKADLGYRNQFGGRGANFGTPFFSVFKPFYQETAIGQFRKFGAGGIQILEDRTGFSGMLATTGFSVAYAQNLNLSKKQWISLGVQPGFYQRRIDLSRLTSGSQWDAANGSFNAGLPLNENITGSERVNFFTFNTGLTYVVENNFGDPIFTLAVAANNLTQPNISLIDKPFANPINWNFQTSFTAFENSMFLIKPTARHIQVRNQSQTNIGSYGYYKMKKGKGFFSEGSIGLGLWYSNQNAVVSAFEINQKDWSLAFSYDFLVSTLAQASQSMGSPEIIIGFRKYLGKNKKKDRYPGGDAEIIRKPVVTEPNKPKPSDIEIKPEQEVKPDSSQLSDSTKLDEQRTPETVKPEGGIKPTETLRDTTAVKKGKKKSGAKAETKGKAGVRKAGAKGGRKSAQNNISDPVMARKVAGLRTSDSYLGQDPYKGTSKQLTPEERALFRMQPRFDFGSKGNKKGYEIDEETKGDLDKIVMVMKARPKIKLEIGGFGCDRGPESATKAISGGRAESVRRYLVSKGISPDRLQISEYGLNDPQADNATEEGKASNRRVQFKFISKTSPQSSGGKGKSGSTSGSKAVKNNISDPAMAKKLAALRTADKFLGEDPYKGTKLQLSPDERALFRKQPHFDFGSAGNRRGYEIDQVTKADLDKMAKVMKSRQGMRLEIGGYGCDRGTSEVNQKIATGRAESVRRYLVSKGVKPGQLVVKSYGSNDPQTSNTTEEGKMSNRRVQYKFLPVNSNKGKTGGSAKTSSGNTTSANGQKPAKSNVGDPAMAGKVAALVTTDSYLGQDPYKGTNLELSQAERDIFRQQPHYDLGSAGNPRGYELDQQAMEQLDKMVKVLKARPKIKLEIGGYGCDLGSAFATKLISGGRAEGVRRYLVSKGISSDRFKVKEYGMNEPQSSNSTEEGKMDNRRVQFKFIP